MRDIHKPHYYNSNTLAMITAWVEGRGILVLRVGNTIYRDYPHIEHMSAMHLIALEANQ